jgi:hypothetical protein
LSVPAAVAGMGADFPLDVVLWTGK